MKSIGIKYQLRMITLIPVLIVALLFAGFYNGQFGKDLNQHMSRLGEAYIRQLIPAAQFAMLHKNNRTLQGLINASTINQEVKAVAFYNAQGQLVAYRGGKHSLQKPFSPPAFTGDFIESKQLNATTINFIAPITIPKYNLYSNSLMKPSSTYLIYQPDDILGWLSIDLDTQSVVIKRYQMLIITIFITLLGLLIGLSTHYFLSKKIYQPISRLRRSMKQILRNEFETEIKISSEGEIGILEQGCAHLQKEYLNMVNEMNHHIEVATEDLQQSLELLEEKNIDLTMEKKKIEEKSRQKSEFIANMSHEIRTPMNGVIGFTNVLLESQLDPLQLDYVKTIQSSAQDLLHIINDILDYTKMDAGKLHLDNIPVDIRACIDEVLVLAAPNAHKKGLDLIPVTQTNVPKTVLGDPLRIKQIITNLISNAVKFTEQGYVLIETHIAEEDERQYCINIAVTDTGTGISKENQSKLFTAFNQADTSVTRRFGGTGLGLVISKKLAEAMDGRIQLRSEPQRGSTFSVQIKLEKLSTYEVEKNKTHPFHQLKAICFDENQLQLNSLACGLGNWGIDCHKYNDFKQLEKALAENNKYDLAFINYTDASRSAIQKLLKKYPKIPTILLAKSPLSNAEDLGARAVLYKPISIQKLHATIDSLINQQQQPDNTHQDLVQLRRRLREHCAEIMIAEDNPVNRMLLHSMLQDYAGIEAVYDGEMVVERCNEKRYQLILLDLQMPKLDGLEAARKIRHQSLLNRQTPILLISATMVDIDSNLLKQSGVNLCIQKPIDEKQLLSRLLELLENSSQPAIDWSLCVQKLSGNQKLAEDFLNRFVEELQANRQEFMKLIKNKDYAGLHSAAHKLHGACSFCGVPTLQKKVMELESATATDKVAENIKDIFHELIDNIDAVINEYENHYVRA